MVLADFSAEMLRRGCVSDGKNFCGTYMGYPFSVLYIGGKPRGRTAFVLRMRFGAKVPGSLYKQVRAQMKGLAKTGKVQTDATLYNLSVTIAGEERFNEAFDRLMEASARAAQGLQLPVPAVCPVCKQPGCDAYAFHGTAYVPVHAYCVQNQAYQSQAKAQDNELNGSYALGILGAVLGALAGTIPNILLAVFADYIVAMLCGLVPLGAYYGYKLLRGRMNRMAPAVTIAVSVLMTPLLYYFGTSLSLLQDEGVFIGPALFWQLFLEYPGDLLPGFLQTAFFVGLGIVFVFSIIRRGNKHVLSEANYSLATLRPMPGVAPAAPPAMQPAMAPGGTPAGEGP